MWDARFACSDSNFIRIFLRFSYENLIRSTQIQILVAKFLSSDFSRFSKFYEHNFGLNSFSPLYILDVYTVYEDLGYALLLSGLRVKHIPNSISLYVRSLVPYISDITIMC